MGGRMRNLVCAIFGSLVTLPLLAQGPFERRLISLEEGFWEAALKRDKSYYEAHAAEDVVVVSADGIAMGREAAMSADFSCEVHARDLTAWKVHRIAENAVFLTYLAKEDQTCEGVRATTEIIVTSIYAKRALVALRLIRSTEQGVVSSQATRKGVRNWAFSKP